MPAPPNDPRKPTGVAKTLTAAPSGGPAPSAASPPQADDTCDPVRYEVVGEHGRGGLGRVLRAFDRRLGRTVAIKELLHHGSENEARFVREALLTARLEHPSIVAVHDAGRWPSGDRFYSMKLISGRSLKELINERPLLADRLGLLSNLIAVADAVAYAHSHGVIHRDLKPANIIVGEYGETAVIDWGLAKELSEVTSDAASFRGNAPAGDAELTVVGAVIGTPAYMSPEQARGEPVDERADVYGLGAILYHLLGGTVPYSASDGAETVAKVASGPPQPLAELAPEAPPELIAIAARAMARSPSHRYSNAQAFADDVRRFQTGKLVGAHSYSFLELLRRSLRRHKYVVAVGLAALLLVAVVGVFSIRGILRERDRADANAARVTEMLADSYADHGRTAVLDGDHRDGLRYLRRALELGRDDPAVRLSIEFAMRPFEAQLGRAQTGGYVNDIAFSPDGRFIASGGATGAFVLDASGRILAHVHTGDTERAVFSPNGDILATGTATGAVAIWSAQTGAPHATLRASAPDYVASMEFGPDGTRLMAAWQDASLRVWDVATARALGSIDTRHGLLWVARYSPDGSRIATAGDDGLVRVWSAHNLELLREFDGHSGRVLDVAFDPSSRRLVSTGWDGKAFLWDLQTGSKRPLSSGNIGPVAAAEFSSDGEFILALAPRSIQLWRVQDGETIHVRNDDPSDVEYAALLPGDNAALVVVASHGDGTAAMLRATDRLELLRVPAHDRPATIVAVNPAGLSFATGSSDGSIAVWDAQKRSYKRRHELSTEWLSAIAGSGPVFFVGGFDGVIAKIDSVGGGPWLETTERVFDLEFDPTEQLLATAGSYGVRLFDARTKQLHSAIESSPECGAVVSIAFSLDGARLAVVCQQGGLRIYDAATMAELRSWSGPRASSVAAAARADEFVTSGADQFLRTWSSLSPGPVAEWRVHDHYVSQVASHDGGAWLTTASDDGTAKVWDARTGGLRLSTATHAASVQRAALDPTSRFLATAAGEQVCLWDMATGRQVVSFHSAQVTGGLAFNAEATELLAVGMSGTLMVWDISLRDATAEELIHQIDCALQERSCAPGR